MVTASSGVNRERRHRETRRARASGRVSIGDGQIAKSGHK
jgi:hypothetical protein